MALTTRRFASPISALREMDRFFDGVLTPVAWPDRRVPAGFSNPPVDVYEDDEHYYVRAVVPGAAPEEIDVSALGDVITIAGAARPAAPEGAKALWQEIPPLQFKRSIQLSRRFDIDQAEATYEHGVLALRIPKAADAKPRTIKIATNG